MKTNSASRTWGRFSRFRVILIGSLTIGANISYGLTTEEILGTMHTELTRSMQVLEEQTPPVHYLSYELTSSQERSISAQWGHATGESDEYSATIDVELRIGSNTLDSSRELPQQSNTYFSPTVSVGIDSPSSIKQALWSITDNHYKIAKAKFSQLESADQFTTESTREYADFSAGEKYHSVEPALALEWDDAWNDRIVALSKVFEGAQEIELGVVGLRAELNNVYFTNSEGSKIHQVHRLYSLRMEVRAQTELGARLSRSSIQHGFSLDELPPQDELLAIAKSLRDDVLNLTKSHYVDPYTGPAILSGRASAVFFHEILGHRLEGQRLRLARDAQTFKEKIGEQVLPASFSVNFDPTAHHLGKVPLIGTYRFDNQGIRARNVPVIENGLLTSFLMSRSPLEEFAFSNGHGRKIVGRAPFARQSNLFVSSTESISSDALKEMLITKVEDAGLEYGLLFEDITGGYTFTGRGMPNAFNVTPTMVYKVYVDGSEELVRGVDLIGTPLTVFSRILAADDQVDVFNGMCGAESGFIPVSAVSPSILVDQIEVQKKELSQRRPPLLSPPGSGATFEHHGHLH